jgi:ribosomal-protein-alanine N-acetyltransferase
MASGITIRSLLSEDAQAIAQLSHSTREAGNWDPSNYERLAELGLEGWVAVTDGQIVGFLVARCAASDLEILNVAIALEFRRQGAATALLAKCLETGSQQGARKALLEVRESNYPAIALYQREGFRITGRRIQYYQNPGEDAILMTCELRERNQFPIGA